MEDEAHLAGTPAIHWWKNAPSREAELKIEEVSLKDAIQCRAERVKRNVVESYMESLRAGETLPPIVLVEDGATRRLVDGFHRLEAARRAERETIRALIYNGDFHHALVYASGANADHGLQRSVEDKQMAVRQLLQQDQFRNVSARQIANWACVSHTMVDNMRAQLRDSGEIQPADKVIGSDGRLQSATKKRTEPAAGGNVCHSSQQLSAGPTVTDRPLVDSPAPTGASRTEEPDKVAPSPATQPQVVTEAASRLSENDAAWDRAVESLRAIDLKQRPPASWDRDRRTAVGDLIAKVLAAVKRM